ncbi:MAG: hypothetical protein NTX53_06375 [candidate division WOR-3 bacterium]|nr:hypothetical protein [candidate division WOR-3 bacterium]
MTAIYATIAAVVSIVGAAVAVFASFWNIRHLRLGRQTEAYRTIHESYDRVVQVRIKRPELLALARKWQASRMRGVYEQATTEDREWAVYYTYAELCIGFCNAVLQARGRKLMPHLEFENQWVHLVKLVITEHYPIISDFLGERKFVSSYLSDFVSELRDKGWDWRREHAALLWNEKPSE